MTRRLLVITAALTIGAALFAAAAAGALTKHDFLAKLRAADAVSSRADDAAIAQPAGRSDSRAVCPRRSPRS